MQKLVIVGAGGAGAEAVFVARSAGTWEVLGFVDDSPALLGTTIDGVPVLGPISELVAEYPGVEVSFHCAIGNNRIRQRVVAVLESAGFRAATLIDPTAVIAPTASIGAGSYIGPLAFVGPRTRIGRNVLINVSASIGHDSCLGDFCQVCPGARVSGNVTLSEGVFLGSNGVVTPGIAVGEWATVAAATLVARDLPARMTAIGVPAKTLAPPAAT